MIFSKSMYKALDECERANLIVAHKKECDGRVKDRLKAVLLYDGGWIPLKIAEAFFIDEGTVRSHLNLYEEEKKLTPTYKNSKSKLNEEKSKELSKHRELKSYLKIKDIQVYVKKLFRNMWEFPCFMAGSKRIIFPIRNRNLSLRMWI